MALRTRQQYAENALRKTSGLAAKVPAPANQKRTALGDIRNKITIGRDVPAQKKAIQGKQTKLQVANKNIQVIAETKATSVDVIQDLHESLMEISISEGPDSFSSSILPKGVSDIDSKDAGNEFLCSDLVMDIYKYLREVEAAWPVRQAFLDKQNEVTPRMRAILVDWLNQVHTRFALLPETLYLTVAIIDRFLQERPVARKHLQLVGVTALFIASKYEEMYSPPVDDFVYIADNAYSKRDIFRMECLMLKTLQFSLARPLPLHFLRRNTKAGDCDAVVHTSAKFFMEISLQDYELAAVPPSLLAAAALRLSLVVIDESPWSLDLAFYSGYTQEQLESTVAQLARLVLRNRGSKLQAVFNKYSSSKLLKVSTLPVMTSKVMIDLAAPDN